MLYTERPSELKVTTSIVHIGMYNINPFRPVTFRKTDNEIKELNKILKKDFDALGLEYPFEVEDK